jgi:pimeloyl-ACP methyl ester carboxylesterase
MLLYHVAHKVIDVRDPTYDVTPFRRGILCCSMLFTMSLTSNSPSSPTPNTLSPTTMASPASHPGTLHLIAPNVSAFEPSKSLSPSQNTHTLIWIGGLSDSYSSVAYPYPLAQALGSQWSLLIAALSSTGNSWGTSSIARDADELAKIVAHTRERRPGGKVVLMGHSTGCQDCMQYLVGEGRPRVDGVVLQAPVSDREAIEAELPEAFVQEANQTALTLCREKKDTEVMPHRFTSPLFGRTAVSARRWVDIASPGPDHMGADDFFSSDLGVERLGQSFGRVPKETALMILFSGEEENVSECLDKEGLVRRWTGVAKEGGVSVDEANGGVVEGASHNLNGNPESVVQDLVGRVLGFVERLQKNELGQSAAGSRI